MPNPEQPLYEELAARNAELTARVAELTARVAELLAVVAGQAAGYKLAAKISGCWRTLATLQRHCRIRSYLTTARSHGRHPLAAIVDGATYNGHILETGTRSYRLATSKTTSHNKKPA